MRYLVSIAGNGHSYPATRKAMTNALRIMHGIPVTVGDGEVVGYVEETAQLEADAIIACIMPANGNDVWVRNRIKGHHLELLVTYCAGGDINPKGTTFKFIPNKPTNKDLISC